jgi:hypothetical protein
MRHRYLSGTELNRQPSLRRLDLVYFVLALTTQGLLEPCGLIFLSIGGFSRRGSTRRFPQCREAFVKQAGVLGVVGRLLGDFRGNGSRLRDRDQLSSKG